MYFCNFFAMTFVQYVDQTFDVFNCFGFYFFLIVRCNTLLVYLLSANFSHREFCNIWYYFEDDNLDYLVFIFSFFISFSGKSFFGKYFLIYTPTGSDLNALKMVHHVGKNDKQLRYLKLKIFIEFHVFDQQSAFFHM